MRRLLDVQAESTSTTSSEKMGRGGLMNLVPSLKRTRPVLIILGWGLMMSGAVLYAIFQGFLLPSTYYGGSSGTLPLRVWVPYPEGLSAPSLSGIALGGT